MHADRTGPTAGLVAVRGAGDSGAYLKTLGSSTLIGLPPPGSVPLRAKDMALLVYLCVTGPARHTRGALAALLWGDRDEVRARHSLTQALRRLRLTVGGDALSVSDRIVEWRGQLACDALELERGVIDPGAAEPGLPCYAGDFLVDLDVSQGSSGFTAWADERRAHFRFAAARVVAAQGRAADGLAQWDAALQLGHRLIQIEPMSQEAHRRVMRAWSALGERALAVRHYRQFERWLRDELGESPDPATRALFDELHSGESASRLAPDNDSARPHPRISPSSNGRVRAPSLAAEGPGRDPSEDRNPPAPDARLEREITVPVSFPETSVATTPGVYARRGFLLTVAIVVVTAALGAVAMLAAAP